MATTPTRSLADLLADGSSTADAPRTVKIDTTDRTHSWRYRCPNGHSSWMPTNGGIWCAGCARAHDIEDPHHHELVDTRYGNRIPWSSVELIE